MSRLGALCFWAALVMAVSSVSCNNRRLADRAPPASAERPQGGSDSGDPVRSHRGGADPKQRSDLELPPEELVAVSCEHGQKAFECEQCRYEVGFVRVPANLVTGGLISTVKVERQSFTAPITLTGEVRFDERRIGHVSSQVEGIIQRVFVVLGDRVKRGQALIEIESVAVGEAQTAYQEAQGLLTLARRNFERLAELRNEKIASEKEYLQAKQEFEAAEIRAEGAKSKLVRLGTGGGSRGRVVLRAPMDGAVLVMHAVSGEVTKTDESLITVGDHTTVWVWADLLERDLSAVQRRKASSKIPAQVSVKAFPGEEFPGTVDLVSPAMDPSSRTVKLRVEVNNPGGRLLAGMFASVKLFLPEGGETLAVPAGAVLEDAGRSFVFVRHHDDYYLRRPVVVGRTWAGWVEIQRGLTEAQTVVADGAFLMKSDVLRSKMGAGCAD